MKNFTLEKSIQILERTPNVLAVMLENLSTDWFFVNEGGNTWNVFDVIGHLVHGEKTDWIPRTEIILSDSTTKGFPVFDRFAQFEESKGKSLSDLLVEFAILRQKISKFCVQKISRLKI